MPYLLVRQKVADFPTWKAAYDAHSPVRQKAGLKEEYLVRNVDDPNDVFIWFEVADIEAAKQFEASSDVREKIRGAGVMDKPDFYYLA